jgi:hypothetical protein
MTMIAYAFLQYRRLKTARREKRFNELPPQLSAIQHSTQVMVLVLRCSRG